MNLQQQRALLACIGVLGEREEEQAPEGEAQVSFDGGPREPVPVHRDPGLEHVQTLLEAIYSLPPRGWGGGGAW
jgi:hypothetical protein